MKSKMLWLRGGIIASIICIILFLFYIFAYFPLVDKIYSEQIKESGTTPSWTTTIPLITGHFFPLFSGLIWHDGGFNCQRIETECASWTAETNSNCVKWEMEGVNGCCEKIVMVPTNSCIKLHSTLTFYLLSLFLIIIYFIIGSLIGFVIQKRK